MVVGEMPESRDLLVLGAGPGGLAAARAGLDSGRTVTLVADGDAGGALALWRTGALPDLGALEALGVEVVRGEAVFAGARLTRVLRGDAPSTMLEFASCVVATGSEWIGPAPDDAAVAPGERVRVSGGGTPALAAVSRLLREGAVPEVTDADTLVSELHRPVARQMVAQLVLAGLELSGPDGDGRERATLSTARRPRTSGLAPARAGLTLLEDGSIAVQRSLIAADGIAAVGDVVSGVRSPQRAAAQAATAVAALNGERVEWDRLVPLTVDLHLGGGRRLRAGSVGEQDGDARTLTRRAGDSTWLLSFDPGSRLLRGASAIGPDAGAFLAGITPAVEAGLTVDDVVDSVLPLTDDLIERPWAAEEERT